MMYCFIDQCADYVHLVARIVWIVTVGYILMALLGVASRCANFNATLTTFWASTADLFRLMADLPVAFRWHPRACFATTLKEVSLAEVVIISPRQSSSKMQSPYMWTWRWQFSDEGRHLWLSSAHQMDRLKHY